MNNEITNHTKKPFQISAAEYISSWQSIDIILFFEKETFTSNWSANIRSHDSEFAQLNVQYFGGNF